MSIVLSKVVDAGQVDSERVVLKVRVAEDVGRYAMFCALYRDGSVTVAIRRAFWFPDQVVAPGDTVVLYTKKGKASTKENKDGTTSHFFYWGHTDSSWSEKYVPVLAEIHQWSHLEPSTATG